jgi:hypothetical protein
MPAVKMYDSFEACLDPFPLAPAALDRRKRVGALHFA